MPAGLARAVWAAAIGVVIALSGVFASFDGRDVIPGLLSLNALALFGLVAFAAYPAGAERRPRAVTLLRGMAAGALVALPLAGIALVENVVNLRYIFPNLTRSISQTLLPVGDPPANLLVFTLLCAAGGALAAWTLSAPGRGQRITLHSIGTAIFIALIADPLESVTAPVDGVVVGMALLLGYLGSAVFGQDGFWSRLLIGVINGAALGVVIALIIAYGVLPGSSSQSTGELIPMLLNLASGNAFVFIPLLLSAFGAIGALMRSTPRMVSTFIQSGAVIIVILSLLSARPGFDWLDFIAIFVISVSAFFYLPRRITYSAAQFAALTPRQRRIVRVVVYLVLLMFLLFAPAFLGQYLTNVLNLAGLYIILALGLNIVVGNAGLLDLGYVAFFAIGAYALGLVTTPNALTCGTFPAMPPVDVVTASCGGVLPFWGGIIVATMLSASFGIVVGLPLLRLRGDFFAVITLGFGEIMRILLRADDFRALLGGAQGIDNIPRPVLDLSMVNPAWRFTLDTETEMYYLILAGIILVVFMTSRLGNSRIGRAWRALRADETAAQAMGIHPVRTKLLAFVLGAGIAGLAGGLAATRLYGVYPDTFTFTLSISVLALVMVGGIGSIPGDILGALLLIGLPEVFSELADYRLLIYGVLLIMVVRVRPLGLYPALFQRSAPEGG